MVDNFSAFTEVPKDEYCGQWVIMLNEKVVAHGSPKAIKDKMKKIREQHPNEIPFLAKVPKKILQIV